MITCTFEDSGKGTLRHVVVHGIMEDDGESMKLYLDYRRDKFPLPLLL